MNIDLCLFMLSCYSARLFLDSRVESFSSKVVQAQVICYLNDYWSPFVGFLQVLLRLLFSSVLYYSCSLVMYFVIFNFNEVLFFSQKKNKEKKKEYKRELKRIFPPFFIIHIFFMTFGMLPIVRVLRYYIF